MREVIDRGKFDAKNRITNGERGTYDRIRETLEQPQRSTTPLPTVGHASALTSFIQLVITL